MLRIERILCPVDFSESSARAYDSAQSLARYYHAQLFLQHVVDFDLPCYAYYADAVHIVDFLGSIHADAQSQLEDFAQMHASGDVRAECHVQEGAVTGSILSFAAEQRVHLIVMGAHGLKAADRATLGGVAEKVLRKARGPVLVSRKPARPQAGPYDAQGSIQLRRVLFCTDFSEPARQALTYALSVAEEYDAEITLLHVLEDVRSLASVQEAIARANSQINKLISPDRAKAVRIKTMVRIGRAYEQIIQYAAEVQADLVIMAVRGRNALDLAVFGSTTYRVIQLGPCSVLAVRV